MSQISATDIGKHYQVIDLGYNNTRYNDILVKQFNVMKSIIF